MDWLQCLDRGVDELALMVHVGIFRRLSFNILASWMRYYRRTTW